MGFLDVLKPKAKVLQEQKAELERQIELMDLEESVIRKKQVRDRKRENLERMRLGKPIRETRGAPRRERKQET
jgi:hypothetical protein